MKKDLFLILGNQLFPLQEIEIYKESHHFLMIESWQLCTYEKHHKQKILLFLGAMRAYAEQLKEEGFSIEYLKLDQSKKALSFTDILASKTSGAESLFHFEIEDKFFEKEIDQFCSENELTQTVLSSPMFLCSRQEFKSYLKNKKRPFLKTFYEKQRKTLKIFVDEDLKPLHGKWSFDDENRKKIPAKEEVSSTTPSWNYPVWVDDLKSFINTNFPNHPGELEQFCFPLTRKGYIKALKDFLKNSLANFGKYQDALTEKSPFVYHSLISPGINLGLITPVEVVKASIQHYKKHEKEIPYSSIEGFIRQVIGWREFLRGIYREYSEVQESKNYWNHQRKLKDCWYKANTDIPPLDYAINKANTYGYAHHIERLMVLSNIMLLCEVHPHEVHRWFMEMFVDSSDWVMGPNVYGMGQFSDGGIFATKPYIAGSNYILKMSNYKKGDWCDVMDGLYWRFVDKHKEFFSKNPRMKMMMGALDRMDKEKKDRIFSAAENFIERVTYLED